MAGLDLEFASAIDPVAFARRLGVESEIRILERGHHVAECPIIREAEGTDDVEGVHLRSAATFSARVSSRLARFSPNRAAEDGHIPSLSSMTETAFSASA